MRPRWWQLGLGIAFGMFVFAGEGGGGGIGISTESEPPAPPAVLVDSVLFYPKRIGPGGSFRLRDLEFLWDYRYSGARGYNGFSATDLDLLDSLGNSLADIPGENPFRAALRDIRLVHDYFNDHGATYNANSAFPHGFFIGDAADPDSDRSHVDFYIYVPGHAGINWGQAASLFTTPKEDSSTGHSVPLHSNSLMVPGPPVSQASSPSWTRPDYGVNGGFNHEFQHAMDNRGLGAWGEFYSSGAEAVAGHRPVDRISPDAPYTWPLWAFGSGCGSSFLTCVGQNYQGWRLFSAYLAYNFRGQDTIPVLPSGPTVGFADDLLYKMAHEAVNSPASLKDLLTDAACYTCSTSTYFHPGGVDLDKDSRLALLMHNWRVANFVNNPALDEGQYGFAAQFGFKPWLDVGAWQNLDGTALDDAVAIPSEVTLGSAQRVVELARVGTRTSPAGLSSFPMILQPYGSEYWVVRSDASLAGGGQDLVIRVTPEGVHRDQLLSIFEGCYNGQLEQRDARLVASAVGYGQQDLLGQPDSLWKHPEWAALALAPQWVDVDSTAGSLEFVVTDFGQTHKAAVVVLSLADGPSNLYSEGDALETYIPALPYRLDLALRKSPYQTENPLMAVRTPGQVDNFPTWSPSGNELAFNTLDAAVSTHSQIYRKVIGGGSPTRLLPQQYTQDQTQYAADWSPRGDWVTYVREPSASQGDIWAYNTVTAEAPRRLTFLPGFAFLPVFQPNGQGVAYFHRGLAGTDPWELRHVKIDGTDDRLLTTIGQDTIPSSARWSSDGQYVYYLKSKRLYAVPEAGGTPILRLNVLGNAASFDFSRGAPILAVEDVSGSTFNQLCELPGCSTCPPETTLSVLPFRRLALRDTTTGDSKARFFRTGASFYRPRWSPEGTRIAYSSNQNGPGESDIFVGQVSFDHAPTFSPPPRDTILELPCPPYTFAFNLSATDPDGQTVTYQAAYLPPGATLAGNHFSWVNPGPPGKDYYVVFRALDGSGGVDNKVVKFSLFLAPDPARPAAANDVTLTMARYTATVTWTAPGDDSLLGTACRFDVRYSASPITEGNFGSLPDTIPVDSPGPAGTMHCGELHGLQSCKWYYVALKTQDDAGQWSALSNVASGKTQCSGYQDVYCESGGMFAQGGGGGGWSPENALLDQAQPGQVATDGYQLKAGLRSVEGQYQVRLLKTGAGAITLDEVALAAADHPPGAQAFLSDGRMVLGTAAPAYRVLEAPGQDVTEALSGGAALPYVGMPGQALVVRLNEGNTPGDALLLETAVGGPASSPDSSGILVQVPQAGGNWVTIARHQPRRRFDRFVVDSLGSATVRLVFLGEHQLRFVGRVIKSGALTPQRLTLAGARHSRLGDVAAAVAALGGTTALLAAGDALTLSFAAPALPSDQIRDWALFARGTKIASSGPLRAERAPNSETSPTSFALYQNQPNPFAASTTFRFDLPRGMPVRLEVFDLVGRRMVTLRDAWTPAGRHTVDWDSRDGNGSPLRPGAYLYRLSAGAYRAERKLVILP